MLKTNYKTRLLVVFSITFLIFASLLGRLIWLQLIRADSLSLLARDQHDIMIQLDPKRGVIFDRHLNQMAMNLNVGSIYAAPDEIDDEEKIIKTLAPLLKMEEGVIADKIKDKDRSFVWLKRKINYDEAKRIKDLGLRGVGIRKETKRFYPNNWLAGHVIGFVGIDDIGLEGLEDAYDGYLRGTPGWSWTVRDAKLRKIISKESRLIAPSDGYDIVLTIDQFIQHIAEKELDYVYKKYKAKSATCIVMDPATGDILALANRPTFNPNDFQASSADSRRNRAVTDIFEPGSVFKIVTASAALEEEKVKMDDVFFCEEGAYKVRSHTLHDHRPHGELSFKDVIIVSSNIGTVKVAQLLGKNKLYQFIKAYGFGEESDSGLPGEVRGIIRAPGKWSGISIAAVPIGQEVAVTPLQLTAAFSAIANNGVLMNPRITKEIRDKEGGLVERHKPVRVRRVISESTASLMKEILQGVVDRGTGRNASMPEYTACGKTGTAQKIEPNGRYSHSKYIASFAGFAPAADPKIVVLVSVDEPRPVYYGGTVAAPAFKKITEGVLRYLKVAPDKET